MYSKAHNTILLQFAQFLDVYGNTRSRLGRVVKATDLKSVGETFVGSNPAVCV